MTDSTRRDQLHKLPKIELHAHLTGSVRDSTILELLTNECSAAGTNSVDPKDLDLLDELKRYPSGPRDLSACFDVFRILHRVLNSKAVLARVTREVLDDFSRDNVVYLELRTTPRDIYNARSELVVSKRQYLDTIIEVIREFETTHDMIVRLLLSVDRSKSVEDGLDTVELCSEYASSKSNIKDGSFSSPLVVGIDFSGNPMAKSYPSMKPIFDLARVHNLPITVHIAEHWADQDLDFILRETRPGRLGHAVCLKTEWIEYLLKNPIPIEICPTSNLITKCVDRIEEHPFNEFYKMDKSYPLTICTDDFGIFRTSLTNEYALIAETFKLTAQDMYELSLRSVGYVFDKSSNTQTVLQRKFDDFKF